MKIDYLVEHLSSGNHHLKEFLTFIDEDKHINDNRWIAYMIATAWIETGNFAPITEAGRHEYFDKYEPGTHLGIRLGNVQTGDGYKYRGRGYCMITGLGHYKTFSRLLDIDFVKHPDLALVPENAYAIMSLGMRKGIFTGVKLSNYFTPNSTDFVNARRIINGTDKAKEVADYAMKAWKLLESNP